MNPSIHEMSSAEQTPLLIQQLKQTLSFSRRPRCADASVLLAITKEADPKILLTRRAAHMSHHAGEVSFPGGKREAADTSNIVVALREAQEEVGLNPFQVELLGELPSQRARSGLVVKPIIGLIPAGVSLVAQPDEIDRIFYVSVSHLLKAMPLPYPVKVHYKQYYMPSFQLENEIIWGLTARILLSLFRQGLKHEVEWPLLMNQPKVL
jgi:8-oxo-dGTP pyrophosphatase MutT (NUDIX family)